MEPKLFKKLMQSVKEADAILRQERGVQIKDVRENLGFSQTQFATLLGIPTDSLRNWEQGKRHPTGAARTLIKALSNNPKAVLKAINDDGLDSAQKRSKSKQRNAA